MQNYFGVASASNVANPNLFINGNFNIAQGAAGAIVAGTALPTASLGYAPMQNNWFNYAVGGNPTIAQIAGSGSTLNRLQITGVPGITAIGVGQRIEGINAAQLSGQPATLTVDLANSLGLPVTWTAFHPSVNPDTFGTIATPTKTQIATGAFTATSTLTRFSASFACPENVRRGIEIIFTVGASTGTWTIGDAKLEVGATATAFVAREDEMRLCQRYFERLPTTINGSFVNVLSTDGSTVWWYSAIKRINPVLSLTGFYNQSGPSGTSFASVFQIVGSNGFCTITSGSTASAQIP